MIIEGQKVGKEGIYLYRGFVMGDFFFPSTYLLVTAKESGV